MTIRKISPDKLAIAANQNKKERDFWLDKLSGELPKNNFPFDFKKRARSDRQMDRRTSRFPGELFLQMDKLSKGSDYSLNVFLSTLLVVLLNKYTGGNDIIIGAPIYKQAVDNDIEFINTLLALRCSFAEDITFKQLLTRQAQTIVEATDHYRYPIELLPGQLGLADTIEEFPLFDVVILLANIHDRSYIEHIHPNMTFFFQKTGEYLELEVGYDSLLYAPETIERITAHYTQAARSVLLNVDLPISQIDILPPEEKEHIVKDFNDTAVPYAQEKLLHELFEEQVQRTPHNIALIGMGQGQTPPLESIYLTYRELNEQANRLAYVLREKGVKPDTIVGVMIERSIEMILAIYAVLKAGGAYLPIDPDYPPERIHYMLTDSDSTILLTREKFTAPGAVDFVGETLDAGDKSLYQGREGRQNPPKISAPGNLFYMIYTSGSTGNPKGAMIKIQGFVNLMYWFNTEFAVDHRDCFLLVAPVSFDLAQKNLFSALLAGGVLCLSSPGFPDYYELSRTTARQEVTIINVAPSVFYPMVEFNADDGFRKLRSLRYLILGGEPIHVDKLAPWLTHENCRCELVNTYGPTECTDISSYYRVRPEHIAGNKNIPIGKPIYNVALFVLDKDRQLLPIGVTGELCIGGDGAAPGYVDRPELTAEKFIKLASGGQGGSFRENHPPALPGKAFDKSFLGVQGAILQKSPLIYCTGDLVRWLPDGNIEFLGRIDYQVKVRGLRIELGEIEERLLSHEMIKEAIVIDRESESGEKSLCAYFTLKSRTPPAGKPGEAPTSNELHEYLAKSLPDYMIPLYFVHLETIPLTPSGKVDRRSLPAPELASGTLYAPPRDEIEKKLIEIWAAVLFGREKMAASQSSAPLIGIDDDFFRLGGHSLKGTVVIARIHKTFDVRITLAELFKTPNVRAIAALIRKSVKERYFAIESVEKRDYYELSHAQQRLYILAQMESESISYNIPTLYRLEKEPEKERLANAFQQLLARHESFRTSFEMTAGDPVQRIHTPQAIDFEIAYHTAAGRQQTGNIIKQFVRPHDLSKAPLLRAGLIKTDEQAAPCILIVDMHHIVSDGISMEIFKKELAALYELKELPPLPIQYKDFARWQKKAAATDERKAQEAFWLKQYSGEIPVLNIRTDFTRPTVQSFAGNQVYFEFDKEQTAALKELAKPVNATLFMVLAGIFNILLMKISGQEDIVIGTPTAGRRHHDVQEIIGFFIDTLPLRYSPSGEKRFADFLLEITRHTLEVFENQDYPFEELVEHLTLARDTGRNPLFDVMFVLQNMEPQSFAGGELKLTPYEYESETAKFDITLGGFENEAGLSCEMGYCTALFKEETIRKFIKYFEKIAAAVIGNPHIELGRIEIIPDEEKQQIQYVFNNTDEGVPVKTIAQLFMEQAEKTPGAVALVCLDRRPGTPEQSRRLTYRELAQESLQLARFLNEKGTIPGMIAGIQVERSIEMVIGLIGILLAGAAYLPLNPQNPAERNRYMLEDCNAGLLLVSHSFFKEENRPGNLAIETIYIEDRSEVSRSLPAPTHFYDSLSQAQCSHLAYIIYTSGSTGNPKGVPITHANFSPLVHWGYKNLGIGTKDRVVQNLAYYFDWSVWEIFITLTSGASLYIAPNDVLLDAQAHIDFLRENNITALHITPTQFQAMVDFEQQGQPVKFPTLKYLFIGAERLTCDLVERSFAAVNKDCRLFNMYGPTEATILAAVQEITRRQLEKYKSLTSIPIGTAVGAARLMILDKYLNVCPTDTPGQLYIAGDSLSRGYLNQPELTAEKFIQGGSFRENHPPAPPAKAFDKSFLGVQGAILQKSPLCRKLYSSGDRAEWLADGTIEFLGRADQQVKIRGFRLELGEIEFRLRRHPGIKEAVVIARQDEKGEQYLCAYYVPKMGTGIPGTLEIPGLQNFLARSLVEYMIPHHFVPIAKIPLNPNGKVDIKALPAPASPRSKEYTPPRDAVEGKLVNIWSAVLGIEAPLIGVDDNFFQLGGHSLKATRMAAEIHKEFNVRMFLAEFFKTPTIARTAQHIKKASREKTILLRAAEKKEYYTLSPAQKRFYILQQLEPANTTYNMMRDASLLTGKVDLERMEKSILELIGRHETLRTSFILAADEPVQHIHEPQDIRFKIEYQAIDGGRLSTDSSQIHDIIERFIRPFDLVRPPLLRMGLVKLDEEKYLFLFDMHHIISDAISFDLTFHDFMQIYAPSDEALSPPAFQYKDYSEWQKRLQQAGEIEKQRQYWLREFSSKIPQLAMPLDYERPPAQSFVGDRMSFEIHPQQAGMLRELARVEDATLFMVVLALINVFLAKLTGQQDIIVGTVASGRSQAEFYDIIGVFINTLALRNYPNEDKSFIEFLREVKQRTLEAFDNQDYQFEELVQRLPIDRTGSRNPLFDVLYSFASISSAGSSHEEDVAEDQRPFFGMTNYGYQVNVTILDLVLVVTDMAESGKLLISITYCTKLFKKETIEKFMSYFEEIVSAVAGNKHILLKEIKISHELGAAKADIPQVEFGF